LGDPAFYVGADEYGQRYAYPATDEGRAYFDEDTLFDVSELGFELDITYDAFDTFQRVMSERGFHWEYDETGMVSA